MDSLSIINNNAGTYCAKKDRKHYFKQFFYSFHALKIQLHYHHQQMHCLLMLIEFVIQYYSIVFSFFIFW